ncbi:MAG: toxic anion resistance protein [Oscillospiraceae bacterium]
MAEEITLASLMKASGGNDIPQEIQVSAGNAPLTFSPEERRQIDLIKSELDLTDSVTAVEYGIGCQRTLAEFSDRVLENSGRGSADTAEQLQALIDEIKALDAGAVFKDNFWARLPFFGSRARRMRKLKKRFSKARIRIERLEQQLERSRMELLRGAELFDMLGQENAKCFRQLTIYIQAGTEQLEYLRNTALPKLSAEVQRQDDPMAAQLVYGFEENLARFENRIHDLELSRTIALQSAPQLKLIQSTNTVMALKIQSAVLNTVPIWKNQFAAAVGLTDQTAVYKTQRELDRMTNTMVRRNAEILRQSAVQTASESRRSGIDAESLKKANDSLIRVIEETLQLNRESTIKHRQAEAELGRIEHELRNALSQVK